MDNVKLIDIKQVYKYSIIMINDMIKSIFYLLSSYALRY